MKRKKLFFLLKQKNIQNRSNISIFYHYCMSFLIYVDYFMSDASIPIKKQNVMHENSNIFNECFLFILLINNLTLDNDKIS